MKKLFALTLCLLLTLSMLAGCTKAGGSDMEYIKDKGTMVVGITVYPPMDYKDENGEWIVTLPEMEKNKNENDLTVTMGDYTETFTGILVGDVYLVVCDGCGAFLVG